LQPPDHAGIIDVARRAGVSTATVSRALRGLPGVSNRTRIRVQEAAAALGYVASPAGTGLASGRTRSVGVVVPVATRWFVSQVIGSAEETLRARDYDVLLYSLGDTVGRARFFDRMPLRRRVDAALLIGLHLTDFEVARLETLGVPVALVGTRQPSFPTVRVDDRAGARQAVSHLLNLGHKAITMISALEDGRAGHGTAPQRQSGYRAALAHAGQMEHTFPESWDPEGGTRAMEAALSGDHLPTAVFAEYDEMAFGALRALRRAGLSVPGDVSLVGFGDHSMSAVVDLTTVSQPVQEQGNLAASLLIKGLENGQHEPVDIVLPTRLVIRGSTSPPVAARAVGRRRPVQSASARNQ
jgi:DNA-binding LacI/PurR family transcriptional regulator